MKRGLTNIVLASGAAVLSAFGAKAADAPAAAAGGACKVEISTPAFGPTIKANPNPNCFNVPGLGEFYVGGAFTGYGYTQSNPFPFSTTTLPSDRKERLDFSNLSVWIQKADGPIQFFVMGGGYAVPVLGATNLRAIDQTDLLFGPLPIAFGKFVINDNWSVQGGRMPTLIGSEAPFTFQNINIQRGLLFFQENIVNQGAQINYANGPVSISVAATDGFYSGRINWLTGAATYKIDDNNTVGINGGFAFDRTNSAIKTLRYQFATPLNQQNSGILSVNYTYSNGPLTITPYVQYTTVERDVKLGILRSAETYGASVLAAYSFTDNFSLAGRAEYIEQSGKRNSGTTNVLYGAGSSAFSFTITPTYTWDRFFVRGEWSIVKLSGITRGDLINSGTLGTGFGRNGNKTEQQRFLVETGITF